MTVSAFDRRVRTAAEHKKTRCQGDGSLDTQREWIGDKGTAMIELIRFDLQKKDEWDDFYDLFSSYLREVCDEEEYQENIDDLHNDELNAQMIEQTLHEHNPYFMMRIVENEVCVGLITYSFREECNKGYINNFYVCAECRNSGVGSAVYRMVEKHLRTLGATYIELVPVRMAERFYIRNGFAFSRTSSDGERIFRKVIA